MISPQLRQQRLRRRPQLVVGAAQVPSTLHSWVKMLRCWSALSFDSAIAARARWGDNGADVQRKRTLTYT
eukprot:scaffold101290_cov63-Phaeocystis_antarctica.AAC.1